MLIMVHDKNTGCTAFDMKTLDMATYEIPHDDLPLPKRMQKL